MDKEYNIIEIIVDTLRFDYENLTETPNITKLKNMSTVYDNVYPDALPTIPVRKTLVTGTQYFPYPKNKISCMNYLNIFSNGWCPLEKGIETIPEKYSKKGYKTCLVSDVAHLFSPDMDFNKRYDEFYYIPGEENTEIVEFLNSETTVKNTIKFLSIFNQYYRDNIIHGPNYVKFMKDKPENYFNEQIVDKSIEWIKNNKDNKFFITIDFFNLHQPWTETEYSKSKNTKNVKNYMYPKCYNIDSEYTEDEINHIKDCYVGRLKNLDISIGVLLEALEKYDLMDNTKILFISDHGCFLGDYNLMNKCNEHPFPEVIKNVCYLYEPNKYRVLDDSLYQNFDIINYLCADTPLPDRNYLFSIYRDTLIYIDKKYLFFCNTKFIKCRLFKFIEDNKIEEIFDENIQNNILDILKNEVSKHEEII